MAAKCAQRTHALPFDPRTHCIERAGAAVELQLALRAEQMFDAPTEARGGGVTLAFDRLPLACSAKPRSRPFDGRYAESTMQFGEKHNVSQE